MLLTASCGKKHQAEQVVEQFVEANALVPDELCYRTYEHFDSTRAIGDSLLQVLQAIRHDGFRYPIDYPVDSPDRLLYHVRMNYVYKGDTLWHTFYLDRQLEHVVAFK